MLMLSTLETRRLPARAGARRPIPRPRTTGGGVGEYVVVLFIFQVEDGRGRCLDTTGRVLRRAGTARATSKRPTRGGHRVAASRTRKSRPMIARGRDRRFSLRRQRLSTTTWKR